mmetsp:Transcript_27434/g.38273  ORF Transcript_27434/g.38273 Transcript_27434/m.38273 type:complete len:173 (+) Transcript_27434:146-664(+)
MRVQRKWQWYAVNHMLLYGVISSIAFCAFAIDAAMFSSRLSVNVTLLLTIVATKLSSSKSLPKIPYLTVLDKYLLACIALIICVIIESVCVSLVIRAGNDVDVYEPIDYASFAVLMLTWISFNAATVLRIKWRLESIRQVCGAPIPQSPLTVPERGWGRAGSTEATLAQTIF